MLVMRAGTYAVAVTMTVIAFAGCGDDEASDETVRGCHDDESVLEKVVSDLMPGSPLEAPNQRVYVVGDTAQTGVFDVTLHGVEDPWIDEAYTPAEGRRLVAVEASLVNARGDELERWLSENAELTDGIGMPCDFTIVPTDRPQLTGDIGRGQTRRGWVVFDVGADATGLLFRLKGSSTARGSLFGLQ